MVLGQSLGQIVSNAVKKLSYKIDGNIIFVFLNQNAVQEIPYLGFLGPKYGHTSHLSGNPVLPKNEVLNNHSVLTL